MILEIMNYQTFDMTSNKQKCEKLFIGFFFEVKKWATTMIHKNEHGIINGEYQRLFPCESS